MSDDDALPFKVVRTNGHDEIVARASNLIVGRAAFETARRLYSRERIDYRDGARIITRSDPDITSDKLPAGQERAPNQGLNDDGGVPEPVVMCGRFTQKLGWHEIRDLYELRGAVRNLQAHYNIAPTDKVEVVKLGDGGGVELVPMR